MATSIIDRAGNTWTISSGQQVVRNGIVDAITSGVVGALYWAHTFYHLNNAGNWYGFINGAWAQTLDPRIGPTGAASSPSGSSLNSTSGTITDAAGRVWALNGGGQLTINGVAEAGTSATGILYWDLGLYHVNSALNWYVYNGTPGSYTQVAGDPRNISRTVTGLIAATGYNFRVYASNIAGNGPFSATLTVNTSSGTVVTGVPAVAAAAGFTNRVFNTDFDSPSDVTDFDSGAVAPWFSGSCNEGRLLNPADWSISNSILSIFRGAGPASGISSTHDNSYVISRPGAPASPNTHGTAYQYGFFEAKMRFGGARSGDAWPSWWATPPHNQTGAHLELDFMEANPFQSNGFWNWFNSTGGGGATEAFVAGGADGYPGYDFTDDAARAGLDLGGGWNIYSCLWSTTRITFYWTSAARRDAGVADTIVGDYPTTTPFNGQTNQGRTGSFTLNGANNGNGAMLIMGGNAAANVQFDWVRVWQ